MYPHSLSLPFRSLILSCLTFTALASVPHCMADQATGETQLESRVTAVTLYRDQAMITRTVELDGNPGGKELVISGLPENIAPNSLFAESDRGVEVRAVRYRARAVSDSPRDDVRELEEEINQLDQRMLINEKKLALMKKHGQYLDKLETFTPPAADFDLGRGVLSAEVIQQLTNFAFGQREEILELEVKLETEQEAIEKQLNLAQRKLREITNGATKQERQAVLFAQKTEAGKQTIRLNYLTTDCSWSPTYTVRAETGGDKVRVQYNGLIRQMSGEDWKDVTLTLSTASPAISAAGPGLAPFRLTLAANMKPNMQAAQNAQMAGMGMNMEELADDRSGLKSLLKMQNEAIQSNRVATKNADNLKTSWAINNAVNNFDCFAITSETPISSLNSDASSAGGEEPAISYQIQSPVSLRSRNNQQMVRVMEADLESDFYHIATPVLTSYVYREAELNNDSGEDFLAGPLTVYLDGRFVGRSEIPTVARGQSFVVGLGADSQLRTQRELVEKSNAINGGNRETKLAYKLSINNYKDSPALIRVIDRMPIADNESGIRVTIAEDVKDSLSKDEVYVRTLYPKGILRWDIEVAGRAIQGSAHEIEYAFTLEYDRKFTLSLPSNLREQEKEYNNMENSRRGRKR